MDRSEDIGYLKAQAKNTETQLQVLFDKHDRQTALITEVHSLLKGHVQQSTNQYKQLEDDVKAMGDTVKYCKQAADDHYSIKKFAKWGVVAISAAWAVVMKVIDKVI